MALSDGTKRTPILQNTVPNAARADASGTYPEYLQIDLPDFSPKVAGTLFTADLDKLRSEIDERSENVAQDTPIAKHELSYPSRVLIVDMVDKAEEDDV